MKEVQYTFRVPDFCPEHCEAFSPFRYEKQNLWRCLHEDQCKELRRVIEMNAQLDSLMENAGGASPAPTGETEADA